MWFIRWMFGYEKVEGDAVCKYEQDLSQKIIEHLKNNPECYTARWLQADNMGESIRSKDKSVLIMIKTGQIVNPGTFHMTKQQKELMKEFIKPVVEKDIKFLLDNFSIKCGK